MEQPQSNQPDVTPTEQSPLPHSESLPTFWLNRSISNLRTFIAHELSDPTLNHTLIKIPSTDVRFMCFTSPVKIYFRVTIQAHNGFADSEGFPLDTSRAELTEYILTFLVTRCYKCPTCDEWRFCSSVGDSKSFETMNALGEMCYTCLKSLCRPSPNIQENCSICMEPLSTKVWVDLPKKDVGNGLVCGHSFHRACLGNVKVDFPEDEEYYEDDDDSYHSQCCTSMKCPMCRTPFCVNLMQMKSDDGGSGGNGSRY